MQEADSIADHGRGKTSYRSIVGQLLYLATWTRPDVAFGISKAAQTITAATVAYLQHLNKLVQDTKARRHVAVVLRRGTVDLKSCTMVAHGDSAFANMEGEKSQCGVTISAIMEKDVEEYHNGRCDRGWPMSWTSSTIKRVVRSTLAAEAYAVSEAGEDAEYIRSVLA